jgi:phospholipid transport system substrate-binding protein
MSPFLPNRRAVLAAFAAAAAGAALPAGAAVTVDAARAFVEATIEELFRIARSGGDKDSQRRAFRALLEARFAIEAVGRSILGPAWRRLSPHQQAAYQDAFETYISLKYGSRFDEFTQVKIEITKATDLGERGVVVQSRATLADGQFALVDWGVSDRGGTVLISNIVVEGVSLVTSERELIGQLLADNGGDVEKLIDILRKGGTA